jgi:GT2 family glycosyltransferase
MTTNQNTPLISIIIVNYNGIDHLRKCLRSLQQSVFTSFEIIVIDNGSSDGSVGFIQEEFKHLTNLMIVPLHYNRGFAIANNIASKKARGKYLLLLNNDTEIEPNCLGELFEKLENDDSIATAQAKILFMNRRDILDSAGGFLNVIGFSTARGYNEKDSALYDSLINIMYAKGAAMIVRKAVWVKLGGLEPLFLYYFEDVDFCWRVWLCGHRVVYVPSAKVFHVAGATTTKFYRNNAFRKQTHFQDFRNRLIMVLKNLELRNIVKYLPWLIGIYSYYLLVYIYRSDSASVIGSLKGIFWNMRFFKVIWTRRLTVQLTRVVSDGDLFKRGVILKSILFSSSYASENQ